MSGHKPRLSVVIPAYNEERRIGTSLRDIVAFLKSRAYKSEIIVADDGSTDGTLAVCERELAGFPHRLIRNTVNHGKGFVVRQGMLEADGDAILFTDADLSTPIEEVTRFMAALDEGYEIVIGSRALAGARIEIRQNFFRELMGKIFNRLARLATFKGILDSQCGFKCFSREAAKALFSAQKLDGFSFDVEILFLAQWQGRRILETPVIWRNSANSRVQLIRDPLAMFLDLLRIRRIHKCKAPRSRSVAF
ncbi:MAG: dolichyl-phosphate beta-glucosyltransferase [Candidatus Omnitrophota bacterium]|jgi:dolichyl-phosphate beta-glucosyltransferase